MTIREIITVPDPRLKQVSTPVETVDDDLRALMDDMLETMYAAPGIGLAAVQVGVAKRVIVMDLALEGDTPEPLYLVNPVIVPTSDEHAFYQEGCLSIPEVYEEVERSAECRISYQDYNGDEQVLDCTGLLATCAQHEMDHLEGILFIDHLSRLKRSMAIKKVAKLKRAAENA